MKDRDSLSAAYQDVYDRGYARGYIKAFREGYLEALESCQARMIMFTRILDRDVEAQRDKVRNPAKDPLDEMKYNPEDGWRS